MTLAQLHSELDAYVDSGAFAAELDHRVAYRTESDLGAPPPALADYLEHALVPALSGWGFVCQVHANPDPRGGPFLVAERTEHPDLPTVLTYGHGDVVNGQEGRWAPGRSPWVVQREGDRWYGRGTADNKGQHTINLAALGRVLAARRGRLGYNVKVLIETGEEAGSPGLAAFCEAERQTLKADLFLACDGPRVAANQPTLFMGSRGAVNFTLAYNARERGQHSGNWGGVLANPATVLAHAWAHLVDAHGRIQVAALRPPPLAPALREALAGIPVGGAPEDPLPTPGWGEPGLTPIERLVAWNTLEVLAMGAGNPQRPVNAIPASATLTGQLRFVVGTPWESLQDLLRAHLDAAGFEAVTVRIDASAPATRLPLDHPWVRWAKASMAASTQGPVAVLPNLAGTLPNHIFAHTLGLPTLWVPHAHPACNQHAPDEHLLASVAREGLHAMGGLYWDLGEPNAPWFTPHTQLANTNSPKRTAP